MTKLQPGQRLRSAVCETQVVVIRAPQTRDRRRLLRCADARRGSGTSGRPDARHHARSWAKRCADEDLGLEVLCTKAGEGTLTVADQPLAIKGAKPLSQRATDTSVNLLRLLDMAAAGRGDAVAVQMGADRTTTSELLRAAWGRRRCGR